MLNKEVVLELLRGDVVPALGCTEPVCVALSAAHAASTLFADEEGERAEIGSIEVTTNAGIYKNGMSAGIPNSDQVGLPIASAIGACLQNPEKKLQLMEDLTPEFLQAATALVDEQKVTVSIDPEQKSLYVKTVIRTAEDTATCIIQNAHTDVAYLEKNGEVLFEKESAGSAGSGTDIVEQLQQMKISEIRALVDTMTVNELAFLSEGVEMNESLAAYSETEKTGVGLADAFRRTSAPNNISARPFLMSGGLMESIITKVASAAESRLDGCSLPTMSSSGAGTKGLVVILPVAETAKALGASDEKTLRAMAFAHLVNRYINAYIGKLSPMCSCVAASSTAAGVGIAYLLDGTDEQIGHTIRNMTGSVPGMICDGGKVGCALKVSTGSAAAYMSAIAAVNGAALRPSDGICAVSPEDCIKNMARIGISGMSNTDQEILKIMTEKSE